MDGILNIYKEKGYTSHDVVAVVRRIVAQKKVGHTGTLDPDAQGVLPICLGRATKLADYIMAERKGYRAVLTLGQSTTTQDSSGEILKEVPVSFHEEAITKVVNSFIGEITQIPPMYSAIKIQGKKLYELAREGKEVERKPRQITIFQIEITKFLPPNQIELDVICSKGTYIRTLCHDIGESLGCGGHMSALLRTQSGQFTLKTAITLSELQGLADKGQLEQAILPMDDALSSYKKIVVDKKATKLLQNGGKIFDTFFAKEEAGIHLGETVLAYDFTNHLIGLYEVTASENQRMLRPIRIL